MPLTLTPTTMPCVLALALCLCLGSSLPVSAGTSAHARPRVTWKAAPGIDLTPELRQHIARVADLYYAKTKRPLEITSGYRSPLRQADALYTKLAVGGSLAIYNNQALTQPLGKAYREGRKKRWKRDRIIIAMAAVLEAQVANGHYLSRHMRGLAFDVRSTGMTGRQRQAFLAAVREAGGLRVIHENRPPHFHVEIMNPEEAQMHRYTHPTGAREPDGLREPSASETDDGATASSEASPPVPTAQPRPAETSAPSIDPTDPPP